MLLVGRVVLQLAAFVIVGSLLAVASTSSGTPEHVISFFALAIGLAALALTVVLIRLSRKDRPSKENQ
ncbi:MAG TPA: hypothetical protein VE172_10770 [Stackebrandtia sp.]|jgi:hypothetical protein|uniref:hypothetical protein n=1 Tax=Stackebrandtia sp. TaxID=2023065 RepID=UPI002D3E3473|nr:hypothetical protein [Stackebrandtia sp.]HZE39283.1 hypothetical protein [Stackebrandtia sp.]